MVDQVISADFPFTINYATVGQDVKMAYIDTDSTHKLKSPSVIFMHGNPASSYLWRNIIPHVQPHARCIAPDLIGMGSSSKLPNHGYGWENHNRYLDTFFSQIRPSNEKIILVLHDFGSLLGLHWARLHPERIAGLVLMEFLPPMASWEETGAMSTELQKALFGGPEQLHRAIVEDNVFIELFMQDQIIHTLSHAEMDHYRKPFLEVESREALFEMAKIFPVAGNPPEVWEAVEGYNKWLLGNEIPKLFFWADPGKILPVGLSRFYSEHLKNTRSAGVGNAKHYMQEDHPHLIRKEIAGWLQTAGIIDEETKRELQ